MKKILLAAILLYGLSSCESYDVQPTKSSETTYHKFRKDKCTMLMDAVKFEYEGHIYIRFHFNGSYAGTAGVVHDPNCQCHVQD